MNISLEQKETNSIPPTTESNNTELQQTKPKSKKQRNPLNNSAMFKWLHHQLLMQCNVMLINIY